MSIRLDRLKGDIRTRANGVVDMVKAGADRSTDLVDSVVITAARHIARGQVSARRRGKCESRKHRGNNQRADEGKHGEDEDHAEDNGDVL